MTEQEVLDLINQFIVANGNNEITADVLRPILEAILQQPNELIGDTSQLQTVDQSNLVSAINEVYQMISNIGNTGIKLYSGVDDPNDVPPPQYNIADFYIEKDLDNNPIQLWQYNGSSWIKTASFQVTGNDYVEDFTYNNSQSFAVPEFVRGLSVYKNMVLLLKTQYTRTLNEVIILDELLDGDTINVRGITL